MLMADDPASSSPGPLEFSLCSSASRAAWVLCAQKLVDTANTILVRKIQYKALGVDLMLSKKTRHDSI